ncbi:MAG: L-serine ammonia-lyase, iron-sulfur-dependent subunit beta [Candidatus Peregrinibacteria bacterium]|nr:L-serine ammonia-lyase, iron-sulfur-dependent subunit beta [Candidatus Peregrinibacteria bacterium]
MQISVFDLAGPIMIGPSSSHTAGACKIGQIARALFVGTPTEADFYLYGSFATVYQGHATDKALLAGVMKFQTSDPRLVDAFEVAKEKGLKYQFIPVEDEAQEHHPNTVRIILKNKSRQVSLVGSSIGGGKVQVTMINDIPVDLEMMAGRFFSIIVGHDSEPANVLHALYGQLVDWGVPISDKQTFCSIARKKRCLTVLNIEDNYLKLPQVQDLEKLPGVQFVRSLTKLMK